MLYATRTSVRAYRAMALIGLALFTVQAHASDPQIALSYDAPVRCAP